MVIAEIASGEVDTADVFFLIAVTVAGIAALLSIIEIPASRHAAMFGWAAVTALAAGWLVL